MIQREDVRARIMLSEIPEMEKFLKKCSKLNNRWKTVYNGRQMPDPNDEYLFYQTLIGTFNPSEDYQQYTKRISQYMLKAVKEAKELTGWVDPHFEYEKALSDFIDKALDRDISGQFIDEFIRFQQKISSYGIFNSISSAF